MAEQMMNEKWAMTFVLMDVNRDGVLSAKDRDVSRASFQAVFKPDGSQLDAMMTHIDKAWDLAVFLYDSPDWTKSFNKEEFIASRRKYYDANKSRMVNAVRTSMEHLCMAADVNGTKSFTFEEFQKLQNAFSVTNGDFIKGVYSMVSPDVSGGCTIGNVVDFYTELILGEDAGKHETCKGVFAAAGFAS